MEKKEVAECVGLWLAEGDSKSLREIVFCNNCWELVVHFHKTLNNLFNLEKRKIRVYVYSKEGKKFKIPLEDVRVNFYQDKRATKPYYLWRLCSVELMGEWRRIVKEIKSNKKLGIYLLRGFFAGEGNIHSAPHNSRRVRISQKYRVDFVERILDYYGINYIFEPKHRNGYVIWKRENWDKLAKIKIADLHPLKKIKFWEVYNSFKQYHYSRGYLKKRLLKILKKPYTAKQLSKIFKRTHARIYDVLSELKKAEKISNFRIRSKDFWIREDMNLILISSIKKKYLNLLHKGPKNTKDLSRIINVCDRAARKRLCELQKLGLVKRLDNKKWIKICQPKRILVIN